MDRRTRQATAHGITKSQTQLSDLAHTYFVPFSQTFKYLMEFSASNSQYQAMLSKNKSHPSDELKENFQKQSQECHTVSLYMTISFHLSSDYTLIVPPDYISKFSENYIHLQNTNVSECYMGHTCVCKQYCNDDQVCLVRSIPNIYSNNPSVAITFIFP